MQAWDGDHRLFYMGNAFNRVAPQNGSVWVATYDQDAAHYVRTVIVGRGTPALNGKFNDKTSIEVDRGLASPYAGNVYVAWSVFQGLHGNNEIMFARSTDHGQTFSHPMKISEGSLGNQFADIAVTRNGTVYVAWNGTVGSRANGRDAMLWVRSTDGGRSFTKPAVAADFDGFDAADFVGDPEAAEEAREEAFENADGPESEVGAELRGQRPRLRFRTVRLRERLRVLPPRQPAADHRGPGGHRPTPCTWSYDATVPSTEVPSTSTYNTAPVRNGTLMVGQGAIYFTKKVGNGAWAPSRPLAPTPVGHQFFPDINADGGYLFALWHDSRNDPGYSVQNPPGNATATDAQGFHLPTRGLDTYGATSVDGGPTGRWSGFRRPRRCRTTRCSATAGSRSTVTTTTCRTSATSPSAPGPTPARSSGATTRGTPAARDSTCCSVGCPPRTARTPARTPEDSTRTSSARRTAADTHTAGAGRNLSGFRGP